MTGRTSRKSLPAVELSAQQKGSALSTEAQPYQDFIDRVFFQMAGMTDEEIEGLEERLATML
jgi:hypothetical protein